MHPDQRINGRPRAAAPRLQHRRSCRLSNTLRSSGKNSKTLPHRTFRHFHLFRRIFRKHRHRLPDTQVHNCRQNPSFPDNPDSFLQIVIPPQMLKSTAHFSGKTLQFQHPVHVTQPPTLGTTGAPHNPSTPATDLCPSRSLSSPTPQSRLNWKGSPPRNVPAQRSAKSPASMSSKATERYHSGTSSTSPAIPPISN